MVAKGFLLVDAITPTVVISVTVLERALGGPSGHPGDDCPQRLVTRNSGLQEPNAMLALIEWPIFASVLQNC